MQTCLEQPTRYTQSMASAKFGHAEMNAGDATITLSALPSRSFSTMISTGSEFGPCQDDCRRRKDRCLGMPEFLSRHADSGIR